MKFDPPLREGVFLRRYKRFLADIRLPSGEEMTLHCPNTGSMRGCLSESSRCWFSRSDNPARKYACTWEIATTPQGHLAGINTGRANRLVVEAIERGVVKELQGYHTLATEVRYGDERSRIDILLSGESGDCYVEVKNVTLCESADLGLFPDAVSSRGAKHLRELSLMVERGHRAVLFYCVQHSGIDRVSPARDIDPGYCEELDRAVASGVEVLAYAAHLDAAAITLCKPVAFAL